MSALFTKLYSYQKWANAELFARLESVDGDRHASEMDTALHLIGHFHAVSRIFASHLQGVPHGLASDHLEQRLTLGELKGDVRAVDDWYLDYVGDISSAALLETIAFTFTDGDNGSMSREEMLAHVALHASYHRGEVGRLLWQIGATPPWDTFAVHLHQADPGRRDHVDGPLALV